MKRKRAMHICPKCKNPMILRVRHANGGISCVDCSAKKGGNPRRLRK
ncbi:MAG: hypothetical protein MPK62_01230 [Alphaproteobacteria bacterium]|nr:hypothetical protein [Alphaproteobacteria bacterium]